MVINLTPHAVTAFMPDGTTQEFPPAGVQVRVQSEAVPAGNVDGIPVVRTQYGAVEGLPDPHPGTVYLVSVLVLQALSGTRLDVLAPDTGPGSVVRDANGQIIGVRRFMRL